MSHGRPKMPVAVMRSRSEPGTSCLPYAAAVGKSRLKRSLPVCCAFPWVQAKVAPQRDCVVYGLSSFAWMASYQ